MIQIAKLPKDTITHYEHDSKGNINITITDLIRCKDCEWWDKQDDSLQGRCAICGFYPTGYWYCAGARLRGDKVE